MQLWIQALGEFELHFSATAIEMVRGILCTAHVFLSEDLSEKGYLNTFNHITAQTFMTALFSEAVADFIADAHERGNLAELVTGHFSEEQLLDLQQGPVDNYVDMINNEYGQELGKALKAKYRNGKRNSDLLLSSSNPTFFNCAKSAFSSLALMFSVGLITRTLGSGVTKPPIPSVPFIRYTGPTHLTSFLHRR